MTFEKILEELTFDNITLKQANDEIKEKDKWKTINYFIHKKNINKEPLKDGQLSQLNAIVGILQILYNSEIGSPVSDSNYDTLQEMLIDLGIPRLTGSVEINSASKLEHQYTSLRGTLDKVYYLYPNEKRTNKSRKYLDEWIKSTETKYEKATGKKINLNDENVIIQGKYDGASVVAEIDEKIIWLTKGHTGTNKASDVSHIMNIFNSIYFDSIGHGVKFEVMITEDNKEKINELFRDPDKKYRNSRQIVTATLNSNEPDFKAEYLYPVPLRIMKKGDKIEQIHPDHIAKFPTQICKLGDRDAIKKFANENRWVLVNGMRFRTDGAVITILNPKIQEILGRENDINLFEVAYKFTEESATTKVIDIRFETSMFGFVAPVAVFNTVILKGNSIDHATMSNKERFDELDFHYGDTVRILYDIIPYITKGQNPPGMKRGRKIEFIKNCPSCGNELDLDVTEVQCHNRECRSRIVGRILNYCENLRIQNIGYQTLEDLYLAGLLKKGIKSLYKLKKKTFEMEEIDGFGKIKTRKIIAEIESKRRLKDYEFFGSIGIESLSIKTFQKIFQKIKYSEFIDMINLKRFDLLTVKLMSVDGMAEGRSAILVNFFKDTEYRTEIQKLIEELSIQETYGEVKVSKGKIVFSGIRPEELTEKLIKLGWDISTSLSSKTSYLIVNDEAEETSKMVKAKEIGVPIITFKYATDNIYKL
jgi:DNA ligase (NAD+)